MNIKSVHDVRQLLLRFHSVIYTQDRLTDLILMEDELSMLQQSGLLEREDYYACKRILQVEQRKLEK
ncbi:uncharacterized protein YqgQ [Geomicrobium halophilum]|uniref:Uncharacterized protein YqgQ n=1 Tax=Geomicrobium halophilum TaxID=549000 RepID=A0A841PJ37_9BACL|nr:YqgQ family protein [Geomicrobium halophilum]MBB6448877.1 uncharacterized protein YqgQ [Geomicrobium halophilum]